MRALRSLTLALALAVAGLPALAQEPISNLPRNQTLIVENPEGTIKNAGWFNIWAVNAGGQSTGLHQLAMDTLLVHRSAARPRRRLGRIRSPSDKPIYNADFTEMTVKLRKGIFWSDGVEFTADDVVYTTETAHEDQRHALERAVPDQRRVGVGARPQHRRVQAEEAELALPRTVHGALERGVDHAQARLREGRPIR